MDEMHTSWPRRRKARASATTARSVYEDVFGGAPMHPANFPLRLEDYSEIFGAAASACSIPVLDLPPAFEDSEATGDGYGECDSRRGVDYLEIFGGFGGSDFVLSYEELYAKPKKSAVTSSGARIPSDVSKTQTNKASVHPLKAYAEVHVANFETEQSSSVPKHSDDASLKRFSSNSYNTSQGIKDSVTSESTYTAAIDGSPGFTSVDAFDPILEVKKKALNQETTNILSTQNGIVDGGQESEASFKSSLDQIPLESNCTPLLRDPGDKKHHSCTSDYHSTSSGDTSLLSPLSYFKLSEISLQTMPLQGPPPSRSPPKIYKKPEQLKQMRNELPDLEERDLLKPKANDRFHSNIGAINVHAIKESVKGISGFSDELDPSSAAAASVAAIKEAMEQAQARLKNAKDAMDRKRDKRHRRVSLAKTMSGMQDGPTYDVNHKSCCKVIAGENLLKEDNLINECAFIETQEVRIAGKTSLNHEEMKRQCPSSGNDQQYQSQHDELKSSHFSRLGEVPGIWGTDNIYNGHIGSGILLSSVSDIIQKNEKSGMAAIYAFQDKDYDCEEAQALEDNQKSSETSIDKFNNMKCGSIHCMEDKSVADAIMEEVMLKNNTGKLEEAYVHQQMNEYQKSIDARQDDTSVDKVEIGSSDIYACLIKQSEMRTDASDVDVRVGMPTRYHEAREFEAPEIVPGCIDDKKESFQSHVNYEPNGSIKEVKVENGISVKNMFDSTQTTEVSEETKPCSYYDNKIGSDKHQNCSEVSRLNIEKSDNVAVKGNEGDGLQSNFDAFNVVANEFKQERIEDDNRMEKFKVQGKLIDAEIDQAMCCASGTCLESCNEKETQEGQHGVCMIEVQKNYETLTVDEGYYSENQSESMTRVTVACKLGNSQFRSNSTLEESNTPKSVLSRKENNLQATASEPAEDSYAKKDESCIHSFREEVENKNDINIEREVFEAEAMMLKEKKRDREREYDRIAAERADYEARQRALVEAQSAERIAVERATAEARQRALAEAREKAEKTAEDARLRSERAAVERATEEARQRAIKKALAEKSAAEERKRAAQASSINIDRKRKDNAAVPKASHVREDSQPRQNPSSTIIESPDAAFSMNDERYSGYYSEGGTESNLRCKARQERQQRIAQRAAKALSEKNMRDILTQREQAERERLAESLGAEVRRWSTGKEGNLRALLSTLHYILGPDSGWRPIPLTDVITPAAVKKAYRKATLCVHPDKLQQRGATIQQKYICEKVFDLLKEALEQVQPR